MKSYKDWWDLIKFPIESLFWAARKGAALEVLMYLCVEVLMSDLNELRLMKVIMQETEWCIVKSESNYAEWLLYSIQNKKCNCWNDKRASHPHLSRCVHLLFIDTQYDSLELKPGFLSANLKPVGDTFLAFWLNWVWGEFCD